MNRIHHSFQKYCFYKIDCFRYKNSIKGISDDLPTFRWYKKITVIVKLLFYTFSWKYEYECEMSTDFFFIHLRSVNVSVELEKNFPLFFNITIYKFLFFLNKSIYFLTLFVVKKSYAKR